MAGIWNTLQYMPREQLWLLGGILAEILLQIIKRYIWKPDNEDKVKKMLAASVVSCIIAAGINDAGIGGFVTTWLGVFVGAIGYHEATDKFGAKNVWATTVHRMIDKRPYQAKQRV